MEKQEGILVFDVTDSKFAIAADEESFPFTVLDFGDTFEVKFNGEWIETSLQIGSNARGEMIFKFKGIDYEGEIAGIDARK